MYIPLLRKHYEGVSIGAAYFDAVACDADVESSN